MSPERLTSLDASFLYLEKPAMHMHVAGLTVLAPREDGPLAYDDVQRVVEARIHLAPRLRQRVLPVPFNLARPLWVDDERFDLDFHLRRAAIPSPGGRLQLERAVGRVLSRPLDRSKPLWELYVFEGLADDRTAVLLKLHHALADGIGGMLIGSALFDLEPDAALGPPPKAPWVPVPGPSRDELLSEAVREIVLHPAEAITHIARAPARAMDVMGETLAGMRSLAGMGPPPTGPFDAEIGPARRFGTAEVPFEPLRTIKRVLGGTVNDVVLTAIGGGLHALLAARGEPTRDRTLRVMVPVSVRSKAEAGDVGNRVAPAFVDIPVGRMAPTSRFRKVRAATEALKSSSMAVSASSIIGLGAYAPPALHATAARLVSRARWFNVVVSNIPAPQVPLYIAGARLVANYPAMPLGENCGLSIACTSLGGTMAFGLTADWDALPDIDLLARGIEKAIHDLEEFADRRMERQRARVGKRDGDPDPVLLLELGGVVLGLAVLARVAWRLSLSPIPLYLCAGLAFGSGGLLPLVTAQHAIEVGAELGLLLLLLFLGLEYSAETLLSGLRRSYPSGAVDLVLNATPGAVTGLVLGLGPEGALALAGVTYISSSGIVAKLLRDMRWAKTREGGAVVSILVIEDLAMAVYLAILAVVLRGQDAGSGAASIALALGFVTIFLYVARRWGAAISQLVFSRSDEGVLLSILGVTFLLAGVSELVGVSAAVGSLLVGVLLSGPAAERAHDLLSPLRDLFAAWFFVFFGLTIDPGTLPPVLIPATALAGVTAASKLATGWWSAGRAGADRRGRLRAGSVLIARGEFSIAIAGISVSAGLDPRLGALAAAYVVILATLGPILTRVADPLSARLLRAEREA